MQIDRRRVAKFAIDPQVIVELCKASDTSWVRVTHNALPNDAECIGASYDVLKNVWYIGVISESFELCPMGVEAPLLPAPTVRDHGSGVLGYHDVPVP